ncbi:MAG TPA: SDR family NAD(P)-dependent oxidoreductase [Propionibacteriaceae bacterium]|nr:SDR family NAD(P)-dependent oxidoreductase [Propionibacteriaceae bacterium]
MASILITGSADGLGRASAQTLLEAGHHVVVHTRSRDRLVAVRDLLDQGAEAVVGDLADLERTREVAEQANELAGWTL